MTISESELAIGANPPISVIYQDEHIIVVHKPARMLVHKSMIDRHESIFLMQTLRDQIGQHVYPVHRLDKPTSGIMVLALSSDAARELAYQFEHKHIEKSYIAVTRGFAPENAHIDYALKEKHDPIADKHARKDKPAQNAVTDMQRLATLALDIPVGRYPGARFSLLKLFPQTGRKHQLRRHLAHIRHPIIGDTTHGDGKQNAFAKAHLGFENLALCALEIAFEHPITKQSMQHRTMPEPAFMLLIQQFKIPIDHLYTMKEFV